MLLVLIGDWHWLALFLIGGNMDIKINEVTELPSGGAIFEMEMDEETKVWLINYAFVDLLKKGLSEIKELYEEKENVEL
jgi:hypothetical protein